MITAPVGEKWKRVLQGICPQERGEHWWGWQELAMHQKMCTKREMKSGLSKEPLIFLVIQVTWT
ncbi:MAG: hypothetical protein DRI61_17190 [Chloroflexi bacterium]|nr:MAG: hypothetical protein DRI61_17190 [Chloroflexota bacterium]